MRVIFTSKAEERYTEVLQYLYDNFGIEKAISFNEKLKEKITIIEHQPKAFGFLFNTDYRKCLITPYITMIYSLTSKEIQVITLWFNRSNPDKINNSL